MARDPNARLVYSTGAGEVCQRCGWPRANCACSQPGQAAVPVRPEAKLRIEKAGRGGKTVTVVYDLPRNDAFLKALAQELKKACGVGGSVQETAVEVQGDQRDRIRDLLVRKGYRVKG